MWRHFLYVKIFLPVCSVFLISLSRNEHCYCSLKNSPCKSQTIYYYYYCYYYFLLMKTVTLYVIYYIFTLCVLKYLSRLSSGDINGAFKEVLQMSCLCFLLARSFWFENVIFKTVFQINTFIIFKWVQLKVFPINRNHFCLTQRLSGYQNQVKVKVQLQVFQFENYEF